jgi:hypothetical protein
LLIKRRPHMTAPDQYCRNVKKLLLIKRRPHMTLLGHFDC